MRDIKFKCWDKVIKVMREILSIDFEKQEVVCPPRGHEFSEWYNQHISFDEIELMQFTGLKDKNGREIYEGDIVQIKFYFGFAKFKVIFVDGGFYLSSISEETSGYERFIYEYKNFGIEVINNIYENPELIKGVNA